MDRQKELSKRIHDLRVAKGWNQTQLATAAGVDQSIVSDIERGSDFKIKTLRGLCKAFELSPTALVNGEQDTPALMVKLAGFEGQLVGLFRQLDADRQHDLLVELNNEVNERAGQKLTPGKPFASPPPPPLKTINLKSTAKTKPAKRA